MIKNMADMETLRCHRFIFIYLRPPVFSRSDLFISLSRAKHCFSNKILLLSGDNYSMFSLDIGIMGIQQSKVQAT